MKPMPNAGLSLACLDHLAGGTGVCHLLRSPTVSGSLCGTYSNFLVDIFRLSLTVGNITYERTIQSPNNRFRRSRTGEQIQNSPPQTGSESDRRSSASNRSLHRSRRSSVISSQTRVSPGRKQQNKQNTTKTVASAISIRCFVATVCLSIRDFL